MEARQFEEVVACAPSDEEIAEQKTNAMVEDVKTISKQAAVLNIQSEADYNDAAEIGKGIRARIKTVQALFKPIKEAANLAHKRACEQEKALLDPLKKADPDITLSADDREVGGLGIFLVKKTMDDVSYEYKNGQNILRIKKSF